jgi:hypothetical protein
MKPLAEFIEQRQIKFTCQPVNTRPDGLMNDLTFHYKCRITMGKRGFTLYFSQGSGHKTAPTLEDVLSCLADDAGSYENARSFEEWAGDYGWDADSRKAEKCYRAIKRQSEQLKRTLSPDTYDYLIQDVMNAEREAA